MCKQPPTILLLTWRLPNPGEAKRVRDEATADRYSHHLVVWLTVTCRGKQHTCKVCAQQVAHHQQPYCRPAGLRMLNCIMTYAIF
jgi:hypothetical protein